jgi:hypothetical protein
MHKPLSLYLYFHREIVGNRFDDLMLRSMTAFDAGENGKPRDLGPAVLRNLVFWPPGNPF